METRRFLLALSLAFLVFWIYAKYFAPPPSEQPAAPAAVPGQAEKKTVREQEAPAPLRMESVAGRIRRAEKGRDIVVETDLVKVVLNTAGGVITHWELKQFREADKGQVGLMVMLKRLMGEAKEEQPKKELGNVQLLPRYEGMVPGDMVSPLTITPLDKRLGDLGVVEFKADRSAVRLDEANPNATLTFTYTGPAGIRIKKQLTFHNDDYSVDLEVKTKGLDGYAISLGTDFGFSDKISSDARGRVGLVAMLDGKTVTEKLGKIKGGMQLAGAVEWLGQEDKYFTAALISGAPGVVSAREAAAPKEIGDLLTTDLTVKDTVGERKFTLYAGPKRYTRLKSYGHGMERMVDFGWFTVLAKPMFWLMRQFYAIFGNYGVAIILLTIVVRILLFYPSLKSALAMEEMKAIQPQLMAIREKYKKEPQRMNQEMMKLYKEHKVNPLGGCLPMLLQLPFFIALYNVLGVSIELRQAPFISFWIKDLSVYDPYYILPVLMGVSMIATMKMTSATVDPKQQKMMMFMNIAFIFLFAWLPAGLLLYITLSNLLSIVQQLIVRKRIAAVRAG